MPNLGVCALAPLVFYLFLISRSQKRFFFLRICNHRCECTLSPEYQPWYYFWRTGSFSFWRAASIGSIWCAACILRWLRRLCKIRLKLSKSRTNQHVQISRTRWTSLNLTKMHIHAIASCGRFVQAWDSLCSTIRVTLHVFRIDWKTGFIENTGPSSSV